MTTFSTRRKNRLQHYFYPFLVAVVFLFPVSVAAQYKLKAERVNQSDQPALNKVLKKYHVFTINAPELMRNSKMHGRTSFKFDLELTGLQTLSLSLVEQDILSASYSMVVAGPNGKKETGRPDIKTYTGSVTNEAGSIVALTISDKTIFGQIKGKTKDYFIEPLRYYNKKAAANRFVVYETKDVVPNSGLVCGATEVAKKQTAAAETSATTTGTATGTCKIIELAIASDATIFEKYGSADLIEEHNISITNTMVLFYGNAQLGSSYLQFKIKRQYISTSVATDPVLPVTNPTASTNLLLEGFKLWGNAGGFGQGFIFDLGQLWTMKNIVPNNGGVIGLAYLDAVCTDVRYQVNRDVFEQTGLQAGSLVAHETGHNLGAEHDAPGVPFIMAPSIANPANTIFSSASIAAMTNYLNTVTCVAGCDTEPPTAAFTLPKYSCSNVINLTSASVGDVNGILWETPGGTPESSTASSFSVQYSTPGLKTISLTAYNASRTSYAVRQVYLTSPLPNGCLNRTGTVFSFGAFTNFTVGDLQHVFGGRFGAVYSNNTCSEIVSFTPGETYTYKGSVGLPSNNVSSRLQVFIDYNADGDFSDEHEAVHTSPDCIMGEYSFSFTVPANVTPSDNIRRMRVVGSGCGAAVSTGCTVSPNSQVVDFGVLLLQPAKFYFVDKDRDGYGNPDSRAWLRSETAPPGFSTNGDDCNDQIPQINPASRWVIDEDGDGYYPGEPIVRCTSPGLGYRLMTSEQPGDCDDTRKDINPATVWVKDGDGDGRYIGTPVTQCQSPGTGYVIKTNQVAGDCNDADHTVFESKTYYRDVDGDGFGNSANSITVCALTAPAGYVNNSGDCNDSNPAVNPAAAEVCRNRIDDNCNGVVDEAVCAPCANATGLTVTNITSNSVRFNWRAVANPDLWQLQYKTTGRNESRWINVILTGNIRSVTISNLLPNQTYQWQIRARCGRSWTSYRPGSKFRTSAAVAGKTSDEQLLTGTADAAMLLYPNPSNGDFTLDLQLEQSISGNAIINVRDITGKLLLTEKINVVSGMVRKKIQLPGYTITGMYLVEVSANGQLFRRKLIVKK